MDLEQLLAFLMGSAPAAAGQTPVARGARRYPLTAEGVIGPAREAETRLAWIRDQREPKLPPAPLPWEDVYYHEPVMIPKLGATRGSR